MFHFLFKKLAQLIEQYENSFVHVLFRWNYKKHHAPRDDSTF